VAEALAKLVPENRHEVGFRLTCHKLLEHWHQLSESERQETKARLVKVLDVAKDWRECGHIAQDLVLKAEDAQVVALTREAIEREERDMGYRLLVNLVLRRDSSAGVEWLVATAIDWLSRHGRELIAGPLMSALLRRRDLGLKYDIVVTTAIDWCICFSPNRSIERVLRRIPKLPIPFGRVGKVAGMMLDYLNHHGLEPSSSFIIAAFVRPGTLTKIANRRMADKLMSEEACELAIAWLDLFGVDPGWPYVADQLLRLPAEIVDDDKWHRVAARSLARLALESRIRDRDYTLISLVRRRDLLEPDELRAWEQQAKRWLEEANRDATRALKLRDYRHAGRLLAPALPVSAHLGDQLLKISVHDKAVQFRKGAPETACADFEWAVGRLHGNRTWPNSESAMESMETIGLFKETRTIISELGRVLKSDSAENDSDLEHHLQGGLLAVERELEAGDIRSAGHLLAKMLPLADRVDVETRQRTEAAVTRFLALDMAPGLRCGFLVECDHHVADQSWTDEARALDSLDRVGALTRLVLSRMARSGSPLSGERLESALSFAEVLSKELPTRAGLFMPPLLVLAYHVTSRRRGVSISRMALTPASAPTGRSLAGRGLSRTGAPRLAGQRIASVPGSCSKVSRCSCNTL
jgi:hypothetical protein